MPLATNICAWVYARYTGIRDLVSCDTDSRACLAVVDPKQRHLSSAALGVTTQDLVPRTCLSTLAMINRISMYMLGPNAKPLSFLTRCHHAPGGEGPPP